MTSFFPVVHSVLAPGPLAQMLVYEYSADQMSLQLLRRNISDTYLARARWGWGDDQHILRVYRAGWRTERDIQWELDFITHLKSKGVPVAAPVAQIEEMGYRSYGELQAPEGERFYALFEFLPGRPLRNTPEDAALYGRLAAYLHTAADDFPLDGRLALDLNHLIIQPMAALRPLLAEFPEQAGALEALAQRTFARLNELAPDLSWGPCHGDLHEGNARLDGDQVGVFDFDCGGPGFRAYDLAVYWWSQVTHSGKTAEESQAVWDAFLSAYQVLRPLAEADLAALPNFVIARSLWFMGLMAGRVQEFGTETLGQPFFDFGLDFMREWEEQHRER